MTYAFDIPGYVQGHRLLDDPLYYDSVAQRFKDLAGYDHLGNGLTISTGAPVFETVNGNRGLRLNNTFNGKFRCPIPWMGSIIAVLKPMYISGATISRYPLLFGDAVLQSSNGQFNVNHFSGSRRVVLTTPNGQLGALQSRADNNIVVLAMGTDQLTRKAYSSVDGVTVTETGPIAPSTHGTSIALSSSAGSTVRFGNMTGVAGDIAEVTDLYCHYYEHHFFDGNILTNSLAKTKEFMDRLKLQYAVA